MPLNSQNLRKHATSLLHNNIGQLSTFLTCISKFMNINNWLLEHVHNPEQERHPYTAAVHGGADISDDVDYPWHGLLLP